MDQGICGRLLWITVLWSLHSINLLFGNEVQEIYKKVCTGTSLGLAHVDTPAEKRYEQYRKMYENCTSVSKNIEIVFLQLSGDQYDFSFLETIREVGGYVAIVGNEVNKIRLTGLRVIRGNELYDGRYSLYVVLNSNKTTIQVGLKELQLKSLTEILHGSVLFWNNPHLRFVEHSINWNYILLNNMRGEVYTCTALLGNRSREAICSESCHENCTAYDGNRYCWGQGADMCQSVHVCDQCRKGGRCYGPNQCCDDNCVAGCTGPEPSQCLVSSDSSYIAMCQFLINLTCLKPVE